MHDRPHTHRSLLGGIGHELKAHAPFTLAGSLTGVALMVVMFYMHVPAESSEMLFEWVFHPAHVFLSALVTAGLYRLYGRGGLLATVVVAYVGSIGIATLSDCVIPYAGESLLGLLQDCEPLHQCDHPHDHAGHAVHAHVHPGFLEMWWLINPLVLGGIALACVWPRTRFSHAGHVLLSTWASLFHFTMALDGHLDLLAVGVVAVFLFLAVWIPCCTSDIVFPMLLAKPRTREGEDCS